MSSAGQSLRPERFVVGAGLAVLTLIAWVYLWQGAGMGMSALDMTALALFPHRQPAPAGGMGASWTMVVGMWFVMMVAMMTPSVAPLVLMHGVVLRRHAGSNWQTRGMTLALLSGYLATWLVFSVVAAVMQRLLEPTGLLSGMMLWSRSAVLSATVLATAGLYQLSPLKQACLSRCRSPVRFLTDYYQPGVLGAFGLGLRHGVFCVGCCGMLMALLFVGGIMNLVWIAALTGLVIAEKFLPAGPRLSMLTGGILIAWAIATLLV
jgi:predicted metal-binding membrane protein